MGLNKRLIGAGATASGALTPSENFKAVLYTGNGGTQVITGVGFKPDFVWCKTRSASQDHNVTDSTRGVQQGLNPNSTAVEGNQSPLGVTVFSDDGFTVVDNSGGGASVNGNGITYVAWCWKSGGGTTSSNTDGNITSTVQTNTNTGFSILTYSGTNNGSSATVGTGFDSAVDFVIIKATNSTQAWQVFTNISGVGRLQLNDYGNQDLNNLLTFNSNGTVQFPSQNGAWNESGKNFVAYCFKSIDGFSSFGSYVGNSSDNGPIVETGFEPAFVMIKNASDAGSWFMYDNKRNTSNPRNKYLLANGTNVEASDMGGVDFLSNGFQIKEDHDDVNDTGDTYIYMAFAADPDTEAPTLASSFNIETYTGNATSNRAITGLGYKPNFVWIKNRSAVKDHMLFDSVRGETNPPGLYSNLNNAEFAGDANNFVSFDTDGFTIGQDSYTNGSGNDLVAWTWKADDNEPTIIPAAGPDSVDNEYPVVNYHNITYTASGKFNGGYVFNGTTASGTSGSAIFTPQFERNTSVDFTSSGLSVSGWFYSTGSPSGNASHVLFSMYGDCVFNVQYNSSRTIIWSGAINGSSNKSMPLNAWTHIAFTYSASGTLIFYVDGSASSSYSAGASGLAGGTRVNGIGGVPDNGDHTGPTSWFYSFQGTISQVRYFNSVLTQANVNTLYGESSSDNETLDILGDGKCIAAYTLSKELSEVSIVSANANAGFSVVKYTATGITMTVPHGLSAAPDLIIGKTTNQSYDWLVYHASLGATKQMVLNDSRAEQATTFMANTAPTATVFTAGSGNNLNYADGNEIIAYCFHDVAGYSKFGGYTSNASTKITTGFQPDFFIFKYIGGGDWYIQDATQTEGAVGSHGGNLIKKYYVPNTNAAEDSVSTGGVEIMSDGFYPTNWFDTTNGVIYAAFKKNVPSNTTLANSFKVVTYTGNGSTQSITGTGFTPDLVWIKQRSGTQDQMWYDNNRGAGNYISSNNANAQGYANTTLTSFDADGFSVGSSNSENQSGQTFVAWCWKAGNTWQSNIEGSIPSITNTNTANGFSIVKYTGTGANTTVGHSLGAAPEVMLIKDLDNTRDWGVYHIGNTGSSGYANQERLKLNTNDPTTTYAPYWNGTTPTSTVFSLGNEGNVNTSGQEYIAYCWTPISGFSKFGTYSGTGSSQTITTGFTPDFVITKKTNGTDNWRMYDSVRQNAQPFDEVLYPNLNDGEDDNTNGISGTTATGFTLGTGNLSNQSGQTYIYIAFKMN